MSRADDIETARANLRALEARASISCKGGRHNWQSIGGCNAGCEAARCVCSVPVHRCASCGDCDYGENAEAATIIAVCARLREASLPTETNHHE